MCVCSDGSVHLTPPPHPVLYLHSSSSSPGNIINPFPGPITNLHSSVSLLPCPLPRLSLSPLFLSVPTQFRYPYPVLILTSIPSTVPVTPLPHLYRPIPNLRSSSLMTPGTLPNRTVPYFGSVSPHIRQRSIPSQIPIYQILDLVSISHSNPLTSPFQFHDHDTHPLSC